MAVQQHGVHPPPTCPLTSHPPPPCTCCCVAHSGLAAALALLREGRVALVGGSLAEDEAGYMPYRGLLTRVQHSEYLSHESYGSLPSPPLWIANSSSSSSSSGGKGSSGGAAIVAGGRQWVPSESCALVDVVPNVFLASVDAVRGAGGWREELKLGDIPYAYTTPLPPVLHCAISVDIAAPPLVPAEQWSLKLIPRPSLTPCPMLRSGARGVLP